MERMLVSDLYSSHEKIRLSVAIASYYARFGGRTPRDVEEAMCVAVGSSGIKEKVLMRFLAIIREGPLCRTLRVVTRVAGLSKSKILRADVIARAKKGSQKAEYAGIRKELEW